MEGHRPVRRQWLRPAVPLVALVAVTALGMSLPASSMSGSIGGLEPRSLTPAQKKAKAKALAKCKKVKSPAKRKQCIDRVNRKYGPKPGKTWKVGVWDNYYLPNSLELKVNDLIDWTWQEQNGREPHDVRLLSGPPGVSRFDFQSPTTAVFGSKFKRPFKVAGTYNLFCSLHRDMTMQVKVKR